MMLNKEEQSTIRNGIDIDKLKETVSGIEQNPSLGACQFRLKNKWVSGDENRSEVCDFYAAGDEQTHKHKFYFQAGEPLLLAGHDQGANPVEFLLSALTSCMTTSIAYYAALNGYNIDHMESELRGDLDLRGLFNLDSSVRPGYQNIDVDFKIKTDAPLEELEQYYKFSPVYDVVSRSVPVHVTIKIY